MNILICGATGFIGRNILEYFAKNTKHNIYAVYNLKKKIVTPNIKSIG